VSITVVYDTMVFLQEASRPERTHATFQAVRDQRVNVAISPALLAEIRDVLRRDAVRARFPALTPEVADLFVADVLARGAMFDHVPRAFHWPLHRTMIICSIWPFSQKPNILLHGRRGF
jgi:predicted nucleic acid-binding protein